MYNTSASRGLYWRSFCSGAIISTQLNSIIELGRCCAVLALNSTSVLPSFLNSSLAGAGPGAVYMDLHIAATGLSPSVKINEPFPWFITQTSPFALPFVRSFVRSFTRLGAIALLLLLASSGEIWLSNLPLPVVARIAHCHCATVQWVPLKLTPTQFLVAGPYSLIFLFLSLSRYIYFALRFSCFQEFVRVPAAGAEQEEEQYPLRTRWILNPIIRAQQRSICIDLNLLCVCASFFFFFFFLCVCRDW